MPELSDQERAEVNRRQEGFDGFLEERVYSLIDLGKQIGLTNAHEVALDPAGALAKVSESMRQQVIYADARSKLLARMGYFIGELLVQRLGGCWLVNDVPGSKFFARYVVGQFTQLKNDRAMADPFSVAQEYVDTPVPRELIPLVDNVISELRNL